MGDSSQDGYVNMIGLLVTLTACVYTVVRLVIIDKWNSVSPITWVVLANAAYFGFGPLLRFLGDELTVARASVLYPVDQQMLRSIIILNTLFMVTVLGGFLAFSRLIPREVPPNRDGDLAEIDARAWFLALGTLAVGCFMRYFFCFPHEFGQTKTILPGVFYQLELFVPISLAPIFFLSARKGLGMRSIGVSLLLVEIVIGFLRAAKSAILFAILMAIVGAFLSRQSKVTLGVLIVLFVSCMTFVADPLMNLRESIIETQRIHGPIGLGDRLELVGQLYSRGSLFEASMSGNAAWARLDYSSVQAYVMNRYDRGFPGSPYVNTIWAFVPRILYPEKPKTSEIGLVLGRLMIGRSTRTFIGAGFAAEAYWAGGWLFVVVVGLGVGAMFGSMQWMLYRIPTVAIWTFFPCYILALKMAVRIDGFFSIDCAGAYVIFLAAYTVAYFAEQTIYPTSQKLTLDDSAEYPADGPYIARS